MSETGIIVLGHGSRADKSNKMFYNLIDKLDRRLEDQRVEGAAMELTNPTLEERVAELAGDGIEKIVILPLFLFPGIHVQEDIPAQVDELAEKYPGIEFSIGDIIGDDSRLVDIIVDRWKGVNEWN
ncbi:sirohydrochlorin chelatase [Halarsenatibacter silvermanii]|uniref:CbiX protein n=1 Tax=Halarsenatibacter silvermanii TaxID=321763 RepID=A0A1G9Q301_9FIRM|nr:CbiX/SirB N-terminal domain-containing protein [Halarsenatibacter silvermanii]SDM05418.1 CbiX protein [Halarsenatibacter silvermanii]